MSKLTERDDKSLGDFDVDAVPTEDRTITVCHVSEAYDTYGGRSNYGGWLGNEQPSKKGWLGNPFPLSDYTRTEAIEKYEHRFLETLATSKPVANAVVGLPGCAVACHCRRSDEDEPACHLDVVREWLLEGYAFYVAAEEHDISMPEWMHELATKPELGDVI